MDKGKCQNSRCRTQHTSRCLYGNVMNAVGREKHWKAEGARSDRASYNRICISEGQIYEFYYQPGPAVDFGRVATELYKTCPLFPDLYQQAWGGRGEDKRQKKATAFLTSCMTFFFFLHYWIQLRDVFNCLQAGTGAAVFMLLLYKYRCFF